MQINKKAIASFTAVALALSFGIASAASALTVSCSGLATATNITWTGTTSGGVAPVALLWGNGSTSATQVIAESFGTYTMSLQATDASSTVATTTCSATVPQPVPTITSFVATPATITAGQSSVLSWNVSNASSTSVNNGLGTISSTSITVTPSVTTTYTLTATNPGGSSTANVTVTVGTSTGSTSGSDLAAKIQALLAQIAALKSQIAQLLLQNINGGSTSDTASTTPASSCNFMRDLKRGDEGDDVKELQLSLAHSDPSLFPPGLVTGFFGGKTEAALKILQKRFGIHASGTGFFGEKSREFFKSNCGKHEDTEDNQTASSTQSQDSSTTPSFMHDGEGHGHGGDKGNGHGHDGNDGNDN